jgi:hypothetical protein
VRSFSEITLDVRLADAGREGSNLRDAPPAGAVPLRISDSSE